MYKDNIHKICRINLFIIFCLNGESDFVKWMDIFEFIINSYAQF